MSELNTFCPECGFGVEVGEDGCCELCGATATGEAVDSLFNDLADQLPGGDTVSDIEMMEPPDVCAHKWRCEWCGVLKQTLNTDPPGETAFERHKREEKEEAFDT